MSPTSYLLLYPAILDCKYTVNFCFSKQKSKNFFFKLTSLLPQFPYLKRYQRRILKSCADLQRIAANLTIFHISLLPLGRVKQNRYFFAAVDAIKKMFQHINCFLQEPIARLPILSSVSQALFSSPDTCSKSLFEPRIFRSWWPVPRL